MIGRERYVALISSLILSAAVGLPALASMKCSDPELLSALGVDSVRQFTKAQGEIIAPRVGAQIGLETREAFAQIRVLEISSLRDNQVLAASKIADQEILLKPQLLQISGAEMMKPLVIALPKVIDLAQTEEVMLERRVVAGDPSQNNRDTLTSSFRLHGSSLIYTERQVRSREGSSGYEIAGTVERVVELHGELRGNHFLVTSLTITVSDAVSSSKRSVKIELRTEQPVVLIAKYFTL